MYQNGFNRQKVMEKIRENNHGYQASRGSYSCMYRTDGEDYNCCLVGCFIPDIKYTDEMEDKDAEDVIRMFKLDEDMPLDAKSMQKLQAFHDEDLDKLTGQEFYDSVEQAIIKLEKGEEL